MKPHQPIKLGGNASFIRLLLTKHLRVILGVFLFDVRKEDINY